MSEQQAPVFTIEKIYTKDISLEIPHAPQIFLERESPEVEVQLRSESSTLGNDLYQIVLTATVTAKLGEKTMFLFEVGQAGIFQVSNIPAETLDPVLSITCPNVLFPYAREVISDLCNRAGFPPVLLAPVNFEGIYQQRLQAQQRPAAPVEVPIQ